MMMMKNLSSQQPTWDATITYFKQTTQIKSFITTSSFFLQNQQYKMNYTLSSRANQFKEYEDISKHD